MFTRFLAPVAGAFVSLTVALPAVAQTYTYPAPPPPSGGLADSGRDPERLAADDQAIVLGAWDFRYVRTRDNNLFVSRIFVSDFNEFSVASVVQVDCGRALFRNVTTPLMYAAGDRNGVPVDTIPVNVWRGLSENAYGRAMMRTCEAAAEQEGMEWVWR